MSAVNNNLLLTADAAASLYQVSRSLRFNTPDSAYANRTFSTPTTQGTFTFAMWVKRSALSTAQSLFGVSTNHRFGFTTGDALNLTFGGTSALTTTAVFRDMSAWYHIVWTQSGTSHTVYVNGTSQGTATATSSVFNTAVAHQVGASNTANYFNGYLAEVHFIDGQALTPSSFIETNATTGQLVPKAYTGTYGTNGFRLNFSNNSAATAATLGADSSGNGNNWTPNNLSVTAGAGNDSLTDTPTSYGTNTGVGGEVRGNYATLNPLDSNPTGLTNGNLDAASANAYPTIIPGSGQWYYEVNGTGYTWNGTKAGWTLRSGSYNFGQRPFASTATSGYLALCDTNLPIPTIVKGSSVFNTTLYTGTGAALTPTSNLAFSPDLVWIKGRSGATDHALYDTVRGATLELVSNNTAFETTEAQGLTAFNSNGFTVGTLAKLNTSAATYAGWCWDAGSSTVTNTVGTITSQVRSNVSAGFSVITYTGNGTSGATLGHGLGVAPGMAFFRNRAGSPFRDWVVYFQGISPSGTLILQTTDASLPYAASYWASTAATSTIFTLGTDAALNAAGSRTYVCYAWAAVTGYSAFGSYTGNGLANGPFVYLGFRPAFLIIKRTNLTGNWVMLDGKRVEYNVDNNPLYANLANAEATTDLLDITSNGFKLRSTNADCNASGGIYVYACFAENPFQYSRAR
jgi:hypothetical protein